MQRRARRPPCSTAQTRPPSFASEAQRFPHRGPCASERQGWESLCYILWRNDLSMYSSAHLYVFTVPPFTTEPSSSVFSHGFGSPSAESTRHTGVTSAQSCRTENYDRLRRAVSLPGVPTLAGKIFHCIQERGHLYI